MLYARWLIPGKCREVPRYTRIGLYLSGFVVCVVVLLGVVSPFVSYVPEDHVTPNAKFLGPSMEHILGTDSLGRDVAMRILKGTEAFFFPGLFAALIAVILGGVGGAFAGYSQGVIRSGVMGLIQLFDTLPRLVFIILVCSVFEPTIYLIAVVTGVLFAPAIATIIRERVEALASEDYILAHVAHGFRPVRILLYHILWLQCRSVLVRQAAFVFCYVLFIETALSYLGHYGVQEPMPSWGNMIAQGNLSIHDGPNTPDPWHWMSPALAIVFTISGFLSFGNLLAQSDEEDVR